MAFRLILATFASLATASVSAADQRFSIGSYEELIVEGDIIVNLETGKAPSAEAQGPREKLGALRVERQGKVLRIRSVGLQSGQSDKGPVTIAVSGRDIKRVALIGSGKISANTLNADTTRIELRGSGSIDVASLRAFRLITMIVGNGRLTITKAEVVNTELAIDGSANFISAGFVTQNLKLVHNGPASTLLTVSNNAEINNTGAGSITIEGNGTCNVRKAGSATINCKKDRK
jgi:Putative auto-transporter adhesin, head GIN domain